MFNKTKKEMKKYDAMRSVAYYPIAKAGGKYFYEKRLPTDQVYKLFYRQGTDGEEILLFDPQKFIEGKTYDFSANVNDEGSKIVLNLVENDMVIVSSDNNPELNIKPEEIPMVFFFRDSPYMVLALFTVEAYITSYLAQVSDLQTGKVNWKPLTKIEDEVRTLFVNKSDVYYITSKGNPRFKIIKTSLTNPDLDNAVTIAEGDDEWQVP